MTSWRSIGVARVTILAAAVLATPSSMMGCVDDEAASVFIVRHAPYDDECMVDTDSRWVSGLLDRRVRSIYRMNVVVNNQMRARADHFGADPNGVHFHTAEVDIIDAQQELLVARDYLAGGYVPPSEDGTTPGEGVVAIPIDLVGVEFPYMPITTHFAIRLKGTTNGEHRVTTGEWRQVVDICDGCLVCPPDEDPVSCIRGQDNRCYEWLGE